MFDSRRFKQHTTTRRQANLSHCPEMVTRLFLSTCRVLSGATGRHLLYIQDIIYLKMVPNCAWPRASRFLVPNSRWQLQRAAPSRECYFLADWFKQNRCNDWSIIWKQSTHTESLSGQQTCWFKSNTTQPRASRGLQDVSHIKPTLASSGAIRMHAY